MKISVDFAKSDKGEVTCTINLQRGSDDPGIVSIDGMARSFAKERSVTVAREFGHGGGAHAKDWSDTVIADVKHQIDEYRTSLPKDYSVEI